MMLSPESTHTVETLIYFESVLTMTSAKLPLCLVKFSAMASIQDFSEQEHFLLANPLKKKHRLYQFERPRITFGFVVSITIHIFVAIVWTNISRRTLFPANHYADLVHCKYRI